MTEKEIVIWSKSYENKNISIWATHGSDLEAYFTTPDVLVALGIREPHEVLEEAQKQIENWENVFAMKRSEINKNDTIYPGGAGTPANNNIIQEFQNDGKSIYVGKTLLKKLRGTLQDRDQSMPSLGKVIPNKYEIAPDLKKFLERITLY